MSYQVFEASPQAKARIEASTDAFGVVKSEHHRKKYPFDELQIGECFTIPSGEAKESSLRVSATNHGKNTGKKFCVIVHKEHACIEVARIK